MSSVEEQCISGNMRPRRTGKKKEVEFYIPPNENLRRSSGIPFWSGKGIQDQLTRKEEILNEGKKMKTDLGEGSGPSRKSL